MNLDIYNRLKKLSVSINSDRIIEPRDNYLGGIRLDMNIPKIFVGSYQRLNSKKENESPIKSLERIQLSCDQYTWNKPEHKIYVIKLSHKSNYSHEFKKEFTYDEMNNWLIKLERNLV